MAHNARSNMIHRLATAVVIAGLALAMTPVARAQDSAQRPPAASSAGAPSSDLPLADYQAFDQFAAAHPEIISDLSHNPQLVEDSGYLARHPELRNFLSSHSELRSALINDPGDFIEPRGSHVPL